MEHNFIENELIILSKQTIDLFLKEENCADLIALYTFYYYTAKWQKTNQPKATDNYVMEGLHIGKKTLQKAKDFLVQKGLITQVTTRKGSKITGWYIKLNYIWKNETVSKEHLEEGSESTSSFQETNALSANNINTLNANITTTSSEVIKTGQLPLTSGRTYIDRVLKVYNILFRNLYGFSPTISIPRFGKELKKLLQSKSEVQVSALLIAFFDWAGMDGRDDRERSKLVASSHNPFWFFSTVNQYEAKLRNVDGLDLDNEDAVKDFVAKSISSIKK